MSEQRIDTGADAATSTDADPGEGQGMAGSGAGRVAAGGDAEMAQPTPDTPTGADAGGDTEGERYVRNTQAEQATGGLAASGRGASGSEESPGDRDAGSGYASAARIDESGESDSGDEPAVGEVTSEPSQRRREADPGSVAEEFGDRAGTAPDDDIAHPSI